MNPPKTKLLVGISACLLGEHVRYDGGHKLNTFLRDVFGKSMTYIPVCPEKECGLGVPREAMQLEEINGTIRLMTCSTHLDITPKMQNWMKIRLDELNRMSLCGFIFKTKSPSCGLRRVEVFLPDGSVQKKGTGLFASGFKEKFPRIPAEDENQLQKDLICKEFIERIFALHNSYLSK